MVPREWEHPRDSRGHYIPMINKTYREAAQRWLDACIAWDEQDVDRLREMGEYLPKGDEENIFADHPYYWEWTDAPPDPEHYRPKFDAPADHYQYYENVSEGTPVSPVFATRAELAQWLVDEYGYSEDAAHHAAEGGYIPSAVAISGLGFMNGAEGMAIVCREDASNEK